MVRKQTKQTSKNVTKIKNEYVRTLQQQEERRKARKVRLNRRLAAFAVIVFISFGILGKVFLGQNEVLAMKEEEKKVLLAELAEKEEEHSALTRQLERLNDDDYIAKLARQEYFLSDENEIIFSMPKKDGNAKKKDQEKE